MRSNHYSTVSLVALALVFAIPARAADVSAAAFMKAVDRNSDKTISKTELESFAKKRFAELETDNDKTLDNKELEGRLSAVGVKRADADKDKTIDEAEFVGYADKLFDQANKEGDRTLSVPERMSPAGLHLIKLLQ